jgi:hypothetical protein
LLGLFFDPTDGRIAYLQNVGIITHIQTHVVIYQKTIGVLYIHTSEDNTASGKYFFDTQ